MWEVRQVKGRSGTINISYEQQEVPTRAGSDVTGVATVDQGSGGAGGQGVRGRGHSLTHLSGEEGGVKHEAGFQTCEKKKKVT